MMHVDMPTLNGNGSEGEPMGGLMATHFDGKTPLSERFRRAQLRAQMFGDPGETLSIGRYKVLARIGNGAMGTVYRAEDPSLDREVAVKVLHRSDELHSARMTIEAKALAKLSHPNVVTVHEVGTEDGQLFVAMEFVQGKTLQAWLEEPSGPSLIDVFAQAAQGLQAAHDAGIVHRDFKPENVIVGDDGRVRVLDFGMARSPGAPLLQEVEGAAESLQALEPAITRTGVLAGTPSYMAPEQFEGSRVDAQADQFAFCIALHEAIWGVRPFAGETMAELASAVLGGRRTLFEGDRRSDVSQHEADAARAVIERGLTSAPAQRFPSMRDLRDRLRCLPEVHAPSRRFRLRHLLLGLAVLAVCGVGVKAAGSMFLLRGPDTDAEATAAAIPTDNVDVTNRCGGWVEFSMGLKHKPNLDAETYRLESGQTQTFKITADEMVWLRNGDGSFGSGVGRSNPEQAFIIGPTCAEVSSGPAGLQRALADAKLAVADAQLAAADAAELAAAVKASSPQRCGLGTELRNGTCVPVEWDPRDVECGADSCTVSRKIFFGVEGGDSPILKQTRVVRTVDSDGQVRGFKLFGVRKDTAARLVGLQTGDLLLSVNDMSLATSIDNLTIALSDELRQAKTLKIDFERSGEHKTVKVTLRD
ncbi:MAG: protein kinase [Nannocystaceae bacterium]|nr:protein kinase [Nannocystaceae bacterium]